MVGLAATNDTTHSTLYPCMHLFIHAHILIQVGGQPTYLSLTCSIPPDCRGCAGNRQSETCRSRTTPARMHMFDAFDVSHPNIQSAMHVASIPIPHPTMAFLSSFSVISTGTILPSCTAHPTPQPSQRSTVRHNTSHSYTSASPTPTPLPAQQPTIAG